MHKYIHTVKTQHINYGFVRRCSDDSKPVGTTTTVIRCNYYNKSNSLLGLAVGTSLNYAEILVKILLIEELLIGPDC